MDPLLRLAQALQRQELVTLVTIVRAPEQRAEWTGRKLLFGAPGVLAGTWADPAPGAEALDPMGLEAAELEKAALAAAESAVREQRPRLSVPSIAAGGYTLYAEPYIPAPALVLVGGGHVAQQVAVAAHQAGFCVTVVDDRSSFANRERFPDADHILCGPMAQTVRNLELGPRHSVVLVTRGHHFDMRCLIEVIDRPVAYIGMIGSRVRVETIFAMLQTEHRIEAKRLARVHAPIGLDIGAETPGEIALSVVAELIKVRRGGTGVSLSQTTRRLNRVEVAPGGDMSSGT